MTTRTRASLIGCLVCVFAWPLPGDGQEEPQGRGPQAEVAPATSEAAEAAVPPDLESLKVVCVSDRFFFVGQDGQGRVVLSLQSSRGRDGDAWQAEHAAVLHEEERGWVELKGSGSFRNEKKQLLEIPNSEAFEFQGGPAYGFIITSVPNAMTLRIGPIDEHLSREQELGIHRMGSAAAVLGWRARVIEGRVIHEYRLLPEFNPLNRVYVGTWKNFQGFFLQTEEGGDFYVHSQESGRLTPLLGEHDGFHAAKGKGERLQGTQVKVLSRELALGAFRWPTKWRIKWEAGNSVRMAELTLIDQQVMSNWVVGGAAMAIVEGKLNDGRQTHRVYGLAELLM